MNNKKEYFLSNKKQSNFSIFRKKFKCKFCSASESILLFIREKICFSKEEIKEIKEEINVINENAEKFEKVEEHIEDFFVLSKRLQLENDELKTDNKLMMMKINELYFADIRNDNERKKKIFNELGFNIADFNLNN